MATGLSRRIDKEPDYRPHCLNCSTMRRMTLTHIQGRRIMICETVRDDSMDAGYKFLGFPLEQRKGCGISFDIDTGEEIKSPLTDAMQSLFQGNNNA